MLCLRLGMLLGVAAGLYVTAASWSAGYPPEVAIVRGVVGWVAITLLGYVAELVVVTTPARARAQRVPVTPTDAVRMAAQQSDKNDEALTA